MKYLAETTAQNLVRTRAAKYTSHIHTAVNKTYMDGGWMEGAAEGCREQSEKPSNLENVQV